MKKKMPIKVAPGNTDDTLIADKALSMQNTGQYKEAIELYKQLLKQTDNKTWRLALAQCYLQRAWVFAEKGMVKEAVVLWENYAQNSEAPYQGYDGYIGWLLQTNNITKVKACLEQLSTQQLDQDYPDLAAFLGLLILTEKPELEAVLAKDSAFMTHLGLVRAALNAYQINKPDDIELALKQLPFRSAFRDLRSLLKAVLSLPESVQQAQSLLTKIPARSAYHQAARLLLTSTLDGSALVNECLAYEFKQRQIIATVKKFNRKQTEFLELLVKQKGPLSAKIKFNCVLQYRELLGLESAKEYCRAALTSYPAGLSDFNKHFGAIDDIEQFRVKALIHERDHDFYGADYYWKQCITLLQKQGASGDYKIALIMRHIAEQEEKPKERVKWLIDSLDHDPNDLESYLQILEYSQQQADVFKQWLDKAIKIFPQNIELLVLAIKAAIANKAFKKATQYAQAILKIDPVNTFAKQVLFTSHLAHARKLIKTKKFHLVENEIQQAEKLTIGKRYQSQAQLMRGFFVMLAEDKQQGLQQIAETLQKINDGSVCAQFCVIMEALLLGLTLPSILKELPSPAKNQQLSEQELARLVQYILQYHNDDKSNKAELHKALEKIKAIIKQSIKQKKYSEDALLALCQCFDNIGHFELLTYCAKLALAQWRKPIWVFYKIYSDVKGLASKCSRMDIVKLQFNLEMAKEESDQRAEMLIERFLEQFYKAKSPSGLGFFDDEDDEDEDDFEQFDNSADDLFAHLPLDVFNKIQIKIQEFTRKNSPDRAMKILGKLLPKNMNAIILLTNPEVMGGFLMLHATHELGIDAGVTADEILKACNVSANTKPPFFPFF
ncbi:MAG: hypothetical protein RIR39_36 [Pseudomonadota bacterium]